MYLSITGGIIFLLINACSPEKSFNGFKDEIVDLTTISKGDTLPIRELKFIDENDTFSFDFRIQDDVLTMNTKKGATLLPVELKITESYAIVSDLGIGNNQFRQDFYSWNKSLIRSYFRKVSKNRESLFLGERELNGRSYVWENNWIYELFIESDTLNQNDSLLLRVLSNSNSDSRCFKVQALNLDNPNNGIIDLFGTEVIESDYFQCKVKFPEPGRWYLHAYLYRRYYPDKVDVLFNEFEDEINSLVIVL